MQTKKILFYTQVYFLDNAIEYIKILTDNAYEVHVMLDVSPNQLKTNIFNIDVNLDLYEGIADFHQIAEKWGLEFLNPYLKDCASVKFVVYPSKKLSRTLKISSKIKKHISSLKVDYIHLDDFSRRLLFVLPYFLRHRKKIVLNIHDPKLHVGESDKLRDAYRKVLFRYVSNFMVFSKFSKELLTKYISGKNKVHVFRLLPYTVYEGFLNKNENSKKAKYVSFIGRISPYKGIELFVDALESLNKEFSEQQFLIAGKAIGGYNPDFLKVENNFLEIKNKFLSNEEIATIIKDSKLIVCPYIDATQSGVIMTAYALGCPVLVTDTGGLPEYVEHGKTGIVVDGTTSFAVAKGIAQVLQKDKYIDMKNIIVNDEFKKQYLRENTKKLKDVYL